MSEVERIADHEKRLLHLEGALPMILSTLQRIERAVQGEEGTGLVGLLHRVATVENVQRDIEKRLCPSPSTCLAMVQRQDAIEKLDLDKRLKLIEKDIEAKENRGQGILWTLRGGVAILAFLASTGILALIGKALGWIELSNR